MHITPPLCPPSAVNQEGTKKYLFCKNTWVQAHTHSTGLNTLQKVDLQCSALVPMTLGFMFLVNITTLTIYQFRPVVPKLLGWEPGKCLYGGEGCRGTAAEIATLPMPRGFFTRGCCQGTFSSMKTVMCCGFPCVSCKEQPVQWNGVMCGQENSEPMASCHTLSCTTQYQGRSGGQGDDRLL